jgi:hypothetical protein
MVLQAEGESLTVAEDYLSNSEIWAGRSVSMQLLEIRQMHFAFNMQFPKS